MRSLLLVNEIIDVPTSVATKMLHPAVAVAYAISIRFSTRSKRQAGKSFDLGARTL
jgi:hypothetical protein